jgi:hypothetical protein
VEVHWWGWEDVHEPFIPMIPVIAEPNNPKYWVRSKPYVRSHGPDNVVRLGLYVSASTTSAHVPSSWRSSHTNLIPDSR